MTALHRLAAAALALSTTFLVAACTPDGSEEPAGTGAGATTEESVEGEESEASAGPGTATVADQVMAEQTIAAPHGGGDAKGGDLTVTLRAVEVADGTTTVRWALRWDDDAAPADAGASYYDLGVEPVTTVTDREALKAYRPFCTEGAWQADTDDATQAGIAQIRCRESMLVSPLEKFAFAFPNHGTIEVSALLPAPEGSPDTVDVLPGDGLPLFTDATVTYADGGAQ
jgi:hypothetical protein